MKLLALVAALLASLSVTLACVLSVELREARVTLRDAQDRLDRLESWRRACLDHGELVWFAPGGTVHRVRVSSGEKDGAR